MMEQLRHYGVPYMGSKNSIARQIVNFLPSRCNFIDLFAGGCAITHAALLRGAWGDYFINDINPAPLDLFTNAIEGKYANETRWIDRNTFNREWKQDPYIAYCWSYGNNPLKKYLYSKEIEPWKHALHNARVCGDFGMFEEMGIKTDASNKDIIANMNEYRGKYIAWLLHQGKEPRKKRITPAGLKASQNLESLQRLQRLQCLQSLQSLHKTAMDYEGFNVPKNSLIYCDIPYEATQKYAKDTFDHKRFYEWASKQTEPLCISSYNISDNRFTRIWNVPKRGIMNVSVANNLTQQEGLFVPNHQLEWWKKATGVEGETKIYEQTKLF